MPWAGLSAGARSLAEQALTGRLGPSPIGNATEFDNTAVYFKQRYARWPTPEQWRSFTNAFAERKKLRWVGPLPGLPESVQMKSNTFFVQRRLEHIPAGAVRVTSS